VESPTVFALLEEVEKPLWFFVKQPLGCAEAEAPFLGVNGQFTFDILSKVVLGY